MDRDAAQKILEDAAQMYNTLLLESQDSLNEYDTLIIQTLSYAKRINPEPEMRELNELLEQLRIQEDLHPGVVHIKACSAYVVHMLHRKNGGLSSRKLIESSTTAATYATQAELSCDQLAEATGFDFLKLAEAIRRKYGDEMENAEDEQLKYRLKENSFDALSSLMSGFVGHIPRTIVCPLRVTIQAGNAESGTSSQETPEGSQQTQTERRKRKLPVRNENDLMMVDSQQSQEMGNVGMDDVTAKLNNHMYKCIRRLFALNDKKPLNLFTVAVHPRSFTHTVENLSSISHLYAIGKLRVVKAQEEGKWFVAVIPTTDSGKDPALEHWCNFVLKIRPEQWAQLIQILDIQYPRIPERTQQDNIPEGIEENQLPCRQPGWTELRL